ncbi:DUF6182 family protein [Streptomyces sp. CRN 30]|uniref:DUF6182 family protein n=1 Tax=Streptomyces sp. CRN 30 TaxID=3075613 RepID=UPI002A82AB2A|nr:DUF6182 family protein [Streptomyces sp. CRN 30]
MTTTTPNPTQPHPTEPHTPQPLSTETTQRLLRTEVARRIATSRPDLAERHDLLTTDGLLAARQEITHAAQDAKVLAVCVLRDFDLPTWTRATCDFAARIDPATATAWRRDFTRTVFLAGNPDNLKNRFTFSHLAADGSAAWLSPAPPDQTAALRRLLKPFDGSAPVPTRPSTTLRVPPDQAPRDRPPTRRDLHVATAGVTIADCLIHLNHLLAEAVLDGLIGPGDELRLRQAPWLPTPATLPFAAVRADGTPGHPDRLRAYAALTEGAGDARGT